MIALAEETSKGTTEPQHSTATKLARIAWLSARDRGRRFDCLMHHINQETLAAAYHELDWKKAVGPDRVTKEAYGARLDENLEELIGRLKRMAYRPGPTRRVRIPKEGKPGATRPIDIANCEDKLVQRAMARVIEAVYEPLFYSCSYGFRRGLGCHDAIRDLHQHLFRNPVRIVIDVDLQNYFGSIQRHVLTAILREKIADERLVRYVVRMLKAGVLSDGELTIGEEGVPQGSPLSPALANVVAHYVIDEWFERTVKKHCVGGVALFRYCDDLVICCADTRDGERVRTALSRRLARFGLAINDDKTKLVTFSRERDSSGERGHAHLLSLDESARCSSLDLMEAVSALHGLPLVAGGSDHASTLRRVIAKRMIVSEAHCGKSARWVSTGGAPGDRRVYPLRSFVSSRSQLSPPL